MILFKLKAGSEEICDNRLTRVITCDDEGDSAVVNIFLLTPQWTRHSQGLVVKREGASTLLRSVDGLGREVHCRQEAIVQNNATVQTRDEC